MRRCAIGSKCVVKPHSCQSETASRRDPLDGRFMRGIPALASDCCWTRRRGCNGKADRVRQRAGEPESTSPADAPTVTESSPGWKWNPLMKRACLRHQSTWCFVWPCSTTLTHDGRVPKFGEFRVSAVCSSSESPSAFHPTANHLREGFPPCPADTSEFEHPLTPKRIDDDQWIRVIAQRKFRAPFVPLLVTRFKASRRQIRHEQKGRVLPGIWKLQHLL